MSTTPQIKVLFLYNGGTIGMVRDNREVLVPPRDANAFKNAYRPIINKVAENTGMKVDYELMTTKDSSNMEQRDWQKLVFRIGEAQNEEGYDAVVIAHGTDTLAFTAAALAFGLHGANPRQSGLRIPICITGAQKSIHESGSDAIGNLEDSFSTAHQALKDGIADVLVNFNHKVFLGPRVVKYDAKNFDAFKSPAYPDVGVIDSQAVHLDKSLVRKKDDATDRLTIAPQFAECPFTINVAPGPALGEFILAMVKRGVSAVMLTSENEGGEIRTIDRLIPTIQTATKEYGALVFVTATDNDTKAKSISANSEKAGAIFAFDTTWIAASVKVSWLMGNGMAKTTDDFKVAMRTNYAGEVTPSLASQPIL